MIRHVVAVYFLLVLSCTAQQASGTPVSQTDADKAKASAAQAGVSASSAQTSEQEAARSEGKAKASEQEAGRSEGKAKASEQEAGRSEGKAKASEQEAGRSEGKAKASEQEAGRSEGKAKASEQEAGVSKDNAKDSETKAGVSKDNAKLSEKEARHLLLLTKSETAKASHAVPVVVVLQPPKGGGTISLSVPNCGGLSKRDCARISKPVTVVICNGAQCSEDSLFSPVIAAGNDWTLTLDKPRLKPGMSVRVIYGEGKLSTDSEPVLPTQTLCCDFQPTVVRAFVPLAVVVPYLLAKGANGQPKAIQPGGTAENVAGMPTGWWTFNIPASQPLVPCDTVSIFALIDGQPKQFETGTYPGSCSPASPGAALPAPVSASVAAPPAAPAAPVPVALPVVTATGFCADPQIVLPLKAGTPSLTVNFSCVPKTSGIVLYVDNKPKSEPRDLTWTPQAGNPFQYTATLNFPLLPYQQVKVLQLDPAQRTADPAPTPVDDGAGVALPAGQQPWFVSADGPTTCPPPVVLPPLHAGDTSLAVTFKNPPGSACYPDLSQTRIFLDNAGLDPKSITWTYSGNSPLTYTASFSTPLQPYQRVKVLQFVPVQNSPDSLALVVPGPGPGPGAPPPGPLVTQTGHCADPYIQNAPGQDDSISVTLGCMPDKPATDLTLLVNGKPPDGGVIWSLTGTSPITYKGKMASPLKAGDSVKVMQAGQRDGDSPVQVAVGPPKPPPAGSIQAVQEGATSVTGFAQGLDKVRVQVVDGNSLRAQSDASVDPTTNAFTASFPNPLQADQQVQVFGLSKTGTTSDSATQLEVEPFSLDWGRVRGYFTAGMILSNNNSQLNLTNANAFLGFNVDKSWLLPTPSFSQTGAGRFDWLRFNTYFDARLTAIAGGTSGSTTASSTTPTASAGSSTGSTGSTTSASSTANPSPNTTTLLTNNQAAALQVGAYIPITVASWDFKERHYSLFAAPIAKVGFYTVTSAGSTANQAAENANRRSSTFFPFYSYGLRLGHRRDYSTADGRTERNRAPEQLSYLDVSVGKWSNLEYLQPFNFTTALQPTCTMPATDPTTAACDVRQRLWRYGFEGLLVVPNTPLVIGLGANVAAQHPKGPKGTSLLYLSPPDDLRFLFGVRFDASKLTGILSKLGGSQ